MTTIMLYLTGMPEEIMAGLVKQYPGATEAIQVARKAVRHTGQEVYPYQAAVLYALAHGCTGNILEIGTFLGYSAMVLAEAAPKAKITTLDPVEREWEEAVRNLESYHNVDVLQIKSWDYLRTCKDTFDLIFVDGDHNAVVLDLPWHDRLTKTGTILFHDYAPAGSGRPALVVYATLNLVQAAAGVKPSVLVVDNDGVGMIGFVHARGKSFAGLIGG